ncbi:hypothetical protein V8C35DRAFT_285187 [Trichoderma chlorosporum]
MDKPNYHRLNAARGWLHAQGHKIDKAFGDESTDPKPIRDQQPKAKGEAGLTQTARQQPLLASEESNASESLRQVLVEYQMLNLDPRLELNVDKCTWDDVFDYMKKAQADYEEKAESWRGVLRRIIRKTGEIGDAAMPWLDVMPDDHGLGIVRAGLAAIFLLTKHAVENRKKILEAFEEIPIIVASSEAKLATFPEDKRLHINVHALNLQILTTISKLVGFLLPDRQARKFKSTWYKGKIGQSELDNVLDLLRKQTNEVKRQVQDILEAAIAEIRTISKDIKTDTSKIRTAAYEIKGDVTTLITQNSSLGVKVDELTVKIDNDIRKRTEIYNRAAEEKEVANNTLIQMLNEVMASLQREKEENTLLRIELVRARTPGPVLMNFERLLELIGASAYIGQSTEDIDKVLRSRSTIHPVAEAEAVSLLQTTEFRAWLGSKHSDMILIDGSAGIEHIDYSERLSAKSILCASLLATLGRAEPEAFQLFFFCGLHSSQTSSFNEGPRGMMRSLLCDLAKEAQYRRWLRLEFVNNKKYHDGLKEGNIEYLCDAFYRILQNMTHVSNLSVYCIIDGMALYEKSLYLNDLREIGEMFKKIMHDSRLNTAFKLLVTGPHRVQHIHNLLDLMPNKRLLTQPTIAREYQTMAFGITSRAEEILQAQRRQRVAQREPRQDAFQVLFTEDDYD